VPCQRHAAREGSRSVGENRETAGRQRHEARAAAVWCRGRAQVIVQQLVAQAEKAGSRDGNALVQAVEMAVVAAYEYIGSGSAVWMPGQAGGEWKVK